MRISSTVIAWLTGATVLSIAPPATAGWAETLDQPGPQDAPSTPPPVSSTPPPPVETSPPAPAETKVFTPLPSPQLAEPSPPAAAAEAKSAVPSPSMPSPLAPPLRPAPANPPAFVAKDGYPIAGRLGEFFYLRDSNDDFRLYFSGRAHIDAYFPFGAGVSSSAAGSGLEPTFFLRRARPELAGEFLGHWQWMVSGEWGRTAVSNSNGQSFTDVCTVKSGVQTCGLRSAPVEAASYTAQPTDVFINFHAADFFNLEAGQLRIPFSMENRTSENITPFLEASLPVRTIGAPLIRDLGIMAWGESPKSFVHYEVGIFNGDGPNVLNQDANFDGIGRVFAHPFADTSSPLKTLQIGVSGHYGVRSAKTVGYDYPALTTQEGYAFWKPTYTDSNGNLIHILPSGDQITVGGELYWPVSILDLTSEIIYADHDTREARDGYQLVYPDSERYGDIQGYSYYVQVAAWLLGDRQYVRRPGYYDPPHVDFTRPLPPSRSSLELLAKFEQLHLTYSSAGRSGAPDPKSPDGAIDVNVISFGVNFWATRRVRVSLDYDLNIFPGSEPTSPSAPGNPTQTPSQRAVGPAQQLAIGADDSAREGAHTLSELTARVAVGF
jgi:phosphate-selective porin